ncbi:hypothetical protein CYMTET_42046 [Cymbomonas tetramitiformis]|uniref:Uncharacterized protein n=1 Tax=Cymbomonas tetramitiformis TaxID=36881 RepID=A0AAE0C6L9_9CHLO|nr:hypothetical protein CYMTET_44668 [Cymbomonas tetramitiformis]KAK3248489.1 hypothetical protein CYMTET_42051 [Cymbomonas tetramitiformis]KAK3248495.1 hypothetical protein CYMTET_42046 [Cymbomonas tetramitiformis]
MSVASPEAQSWESEPIEETVPRALHFESEVPLYANPEHVRFVQDVQNDEIFDVSLVVPSNINQDDLAVHTHLEARVPARDGDAVRNSDVCRSVFGRTPAEVTTERKEYPHVLYAIVGKSYTYPNYFRYAYFVHVWGVDLSSRNTPDYATYVRDEVLQTALYTKRYVHLFLLIFESVRKISQEEDTHVTVLCPAIGLSDTMEQYQSACNCFVQAVLWTAPMYLSIARHKFMFCGVDDHLKSRLDHIPGVQTTILPVHDMPVESDSVRVIVNEWDDGSFIHDRSDDIAEVGVLEEPRRPPESFVPHNLFFNPSLRDATTWHRVRLTSFITLQDRTKEVTLSLTDPEFTEWAVYHEVKLENLEWKDLELLTWYLLNKTKSNVVNLKLDSAGNIWTDTHVRKSPDGLILHHDAKDIRVDVTTRSQTTLIEDVQADIIRCEDLSGASKKIENDLRKLLAPDAEWRQTWIRKHIVDFVDNSEQTLDKYVSSVMWFIDFLIQLQLFVYGAFADDTRREARAKVLYEKMKDCPYYIRAYPLIRVEMFAARSFLHEYFTENLDTAYQDTLSSLHKALCKQNVLDSQLIQMSYLDTISSADPPDHEFKWKVRGDLEKEMMIQSLSPSMQSDWNSFLETCDHFYVRNDLFGFQNQVVYDMVGTELNLVDTLHKLMDSEHRGMGAPLVLP